MTAPPDLMVCAVCSRVLDRFVEDGTGRVSWLHTADIRTKGEDHPAVPVQARALASVATNCDFCWADQPAWTLPVETFQYPGAPGHFSEGDWAMCDECASLYRRGYLDRLSDHALREEARRRGRRLIPYAEQMTRLMHRELWKHVTGPVRRNDDA
jgi:hypothetical protein